MKKYVEGSFTIEASFLMPILILLFVFLLHLTIRLYVKVDQTASEYHQVQEIKSTEIFRKTEWIRDIVQKEGT